MGRVKVLQPQWFSSSSTFQTNKLAAVYQKSRTITPLENFNAQNNISVEGNRGRWRKLNMPHTNKFQNRFTWTQKLGIVASKKLAFDFKIAATKLRFHVTQTVQEKMKSHFEVLESRLELPNAKTNRRLQIYI
jgi:hypothetical protein